MQASLTVILALAAVQLPPDDSIAGYQLQARNLSAPGVLELAQLVPYTDATDPTPGLMAPVSFQVQAGATYGLSIQLTSTGGVPLGTALSTEFTAPTSAPAPSPSPSPAPAPTPSPYPDTQALVPASVGVTITF